jgi:hypothetical protein
VGDVVLIAAFLLLGVSGFALTEVIFWESR